jgi:septal ring factor EnvC (AmiA/AmiB activator)
MAIAGLAASACVVTTVTGSASGDNVTQLKNKLGSAQSQLNGAKQREQTLSGRVAGLDRRVSSLGTQISLVQAREAVARERLAAYEQRLAATTNALARERRHLAHVRKLLDRAQSALKAELVSQYEQPQQSVVSLLVDASGVQQLVNGLQYLSSAKHREQSIITATRTARGAAQTAAVRLTTLQHGDAQAAGEASTQSNALAGMNALLNSRQAALADERAAQTAALAASQERGAQL